MLQNTLQIIFLTVWCQNESCGTLRTTLVPVESFKMSETDDIAANLHRVATIPSQDGQRNMTELDAINIAIATVGL